MPGDGFPFVVRHLWGQLFGKLPTPTATFEGKTVIITGSNTGLGFEAARHVVKLGVAKLIMAVRSAEKGNAAKHVIEESTGCDPSIIDVWILDLSSYESVKQFAAKVTSDLPRVDVLLENAGVAYFTWNWEGDNERMVKVNDISTFLLAFLLLPKLKDTAKRFSIRPTLSVVSSDSHHMIDFKEKDAPEGIFATLNDETKFNQDRYPTTKLIQIFAVREMVARTAGGSYPVTVNLVNPGICQSDLSRDVDGLGFRIMKAIFARPTEVGSRTLVHGASAGPETHGQYLDKCQISQPAKIVTGPEGPKLQRRVYEELVAKLEEIEPGISANL